MRKIKIKPIKKLPPLIIYAPTRQAAWARWQEEVDKLKRAAWQKQVAEVFPGLFRSDLFATD